MMYIMYNTIYILDTNILYNNYIYIYIYCSYGSVAKASDTQAVGHGSEPRPDH